MMKKIILILLLFNTLSSLANDIEINGVNYSITSVINRTIEVSKIVNNSVEAITIPEKVEFEGNYYTVISIGESAFKNANIKKIVLPESIEDISSLAFAWSSIENLEIPATTKYIHTSAFYGCRNLTNVYFKGTIHRTIADSAFGNCSNLQAVYITDLESWLNITFRNEDSNPLYYAKHLYIGDREVTNLVIPYNTTIIWVNAFAGGNSFKSVSLQENIKEIYDDAFKECNNIETVLCYAQVPPFLSTTAFTSKVFLHATLIVPKGCKEKYQNDQYWRAFQNIIEIGEQSPIMQCEKPIISYSHGQLNFYSDTPGATYKYTISSKDITDNNVSLNGIADITGIYNIYAYAIADGYKQSNTTQATLYWLNANIETTNINQAKTRGIVVSCHDGFILISGLDNNESVSFYTVDGKALGTQKAISGTVSYAIGSNAQIVIARIGENSIKIINN